MRARWKILSGTGIAGIWIAAVIVGQSTDVKGDTTSSSSGPDLEYHEPNTPYPLGPHAISFEQLSAAEKAGLDQVQETIETSQSAASHQTWAAAVISAGEAAQTEIASRAVGLEGTESDGVVP